MSKRCRRRSSETGAAGTSQSYFVLDWEGDTLYFVSGHVGCCVGRCRALSRWGKEAAIVGMDQEMQEEVIRDRGQREPVPNYFVLDW